MFEYKRIAVIGCCGAGKSVFSRKLASVTGLPLYHLDIMYWREDCTHIDRTDFMEKQNDVINTEKWIIDGNYRNTLENRIKAAELIFFFDLPTEICLNGALTRGERADMPCILPPNDEIKEFIVNYNKTTKPIVLDLFNKYSDKKVIIFHSHKAADDFIMRLADICKTYEVNNND